jgi:hypothetical protein
MINRDIHWMRMRPTSWPPNGKRMSAFSSAESADFTTLEANRSIWMVGSSGIYRVFVAALFGYRQKHRGVKANQRDSNIGRGR